MSRISIQINDFEDVFKDTLSIRVTFFDEDASDHETSAEVSFSLKRSDLPYSQLREHCIKRAKELLATTASALMV
jgi:hypothetical protein